MRYRSEKNAELVARYWGKPLDRRDWFALQAKDGEDETELLIYDVIGWPFIAASELVQQLSGVQSKAITVRINSPGGDVFDAVAIYNALREHPARVTTRIESLAASAASVIAMAGERVTAHKSGMLMIHEPWAIAAGDQHLLRDTADVLGKISGNLLDIYYAKTQADKRKLKKEMEDETWFTAAEAKDRGLVDEVLDQPAAKAAFDLSMFAHAPTGSGPQGRELSEREVERALRDAGASQAFAKRFISTQRDAGSGAELQSQRDAELGEVVRVAASLLQTVRG